MTYHLLQTIWSDLRKNACTLSLGSAAELLQNVSVNNKNTNGEFIKLLELQLRYGDCYLGEIIKYKTTVWRESSRVWSQYS